MDRERDSNAKWNSRRSRIWTQRIAGPVQFERFTALDPAGRPRIYYRFKLSEDQQRLDDSVYAILHEFKHNLEGRETGLQFKHDRKFGKIWSLPDHELGRVTADAIDQALFTLGDELDRHESRDR